jgi:hypothetical protein
MRIWAKVQGSPRYSAPVSPTFNGSDMDISSKLINGMPWPLGYVKLLDTFDWEIAHNSHLFGILIPTIMSVHDIDTVIEIGIDRA